MAYSESMGRVPGADTPLETVRNLRQQDGGGYACRRGPGGVARTGVQWCMQGDFLGNCSCNYGCPCETMLDPTYGHCDGVMAMQIDEGYYGDVRLDGVIIAATFYFPRAIHHGGGHMQPILPDNTTEAQREAVFKIMS